MSAPPAPLPRPLPLTVEPGARLAEERHDLQDPRLDGISARRWLETHREPFVLIDADYTIVAANQAYAEAYGTRPESIVGRKCHDVSHRSAEPCHRHGEHCPHQIVFATGGPAQVVHVHYDAHGRSDRVRLSAHPIRLANGQMLMSESVERLESLDDDPDNDDASMVGASPGFNRMMAQLHDAAQSPLPLLLTGETGAGKEVAARWVHRHSPRADRPLIVIDCTAIPETLFEAEVFGHERGAFSGPTHRRIGLAEEAHGGTLFFDEIGELPPGIQAKLLRFIENGEFRRLGSNQLRRVDCRIISATHRPIHAAEQAPGFRRDLYFRLSAQEVRIPSLRERRSDIGRIAEAILRPHCRVSAARVLSDAARGWLARLPWPGNVRELRNVLQRAAQRAGGGRIEITHLERDGDPHGGQSGEWSEWAERTEHAERTDWTERTERECQHGAPHAARRLLPIEPAAAPRRDGDIATLLARGLSRRAVAEQLGISERTVYRHLARRADGR